MDSNEILFAVVVVLAGIIVIRNKAANAAPMQTPQSGDVAPQTMPFPYNIPHGH
jgi:hypothetical protein